MTKKRTLRFFLDAEFNEQAAPFRLDPISIALVPEDPSAPDYYGVSREYDTGKITPWLEQNVIKHLPPENQRRTNAEIRDDMATYLKSFAGEKPDRVEIWAYNGGTDQVVMAQFFGGLLPLRDAFKAAGLPKPSFRDIKELTRATGESLPPPENAHDCHVDAIWTRDVFQHLKNKLPAERRFLID
ncbi:MAG: 3'-5' exoribonuclease [Alphaproteobacteria bacterium]|nr:3'-5' exoribonuclease [Alphaproteobacteria bacterium]